MTPERCSLSRLNSAGHPHTHSYSTLLHTQVAEIEADVRAMNEDRTGVK